MKLHAVFASGGCVALLVAFLAPSRVAPTAYLLGMGLMIVACMLLTIQRYEENVIDRDRRRFR